MMMNVKRHFAYHSILACGLFAILASTVAKPSFSLTPSLPSFTSFTQDYVGRKHAAQMKGYSGIRQQNDSLLMIYYHDQTVAIVELGPEKLLIGCELIEIYNESAGKKLLKQLSKINRPLEIQFTDMLNLMNQCDIVENQNVKRNQRRNTHPASDEDTSKTFAFGKNNPFSVFSGIIPGTKWCGTGDIATTYNDLGTEENMDSCCRTHDLCPVKIRAYEAKYNITNNSLYTKSHCVCDDMLFDCLKKLDDTPAAQLMGSIYFNIVQVPCIHETPKGIQYRKAREGF
ncbi:uncharacterized protein LOC129565749 [Sitodiplosis mosellana]|uniref:uncharacterized protein LOC129565749 n=1 Tax=Sitodiplosis mosellana TaxID=263140 RepID=UPI0024444FF6|nr:uncharacterized protein LOC129565749 [Sitodiplosis mosellana]XP_055296932.1 uncharacterized protein LOC129565749 [Sitodiplosis mosellana]XP_055296933.1 uncharacterized protein LOC129565749 [Sitodiplosis mosellana]